MSAPERILPYAERVRRITRNNRASVTTAKLHCTSVVRVIQGKLFGLPWLGTDRDTVSAAVEDALREAMMALARRDGQSPRLPEIHGNKAPSPHADRLRQMIEVECLSYGEAARRIGLSSNRVAAICRMERIGKWRARV